jgi:hypothetical protein
MMILRFLRAVLCVVVSFIAPVDYGTDVIAAMALTGILYDAW